MEMFRVFSTISLIAITMSADLEISRVRPNKPGGWEKGTDSFKILPSLSDHGTPGNSSNCTQLCATFNAEMSSQSVDDQCSCSCPTENATLLFKNNKWRCRENSNVRDLLCPFTECFRFDKETYGSEIRILHVNDYKKTELSAQHPVRCQVHVTYYIACNGSEEAILRSTSPFTLEREPNGYYGWFKQYLKVKNKTLNSNFLGGRIIKLKIDCRSYGHPWPSYRSLLLKYEGTLTCPLSMPTLQPSVTSIPPHTTSTSSASTATTGQPTRHSGIVTKTSSKLSSDSVSSPNVAVTVSTVSENPRTVSERQTTVQDISTLVTYTSTMISEIPPTYSEPRRTVYDALVTTLATNEPRTSDATASYSSNVTKVARTIAPQTSTAGKNSMSFALVAGVVLSILVISMSIYRY